jgi:hypothetical protein
LLLCLQKKIFSHPFSGFNFTPLIQARKTILANEIPEIADNNREGLKRKFWPAIIAEMI